MHAYANPLLPRIGRGLEYAVCISGKQTHGPYLGDTSTSTLIVSATAAPNSVLFVTETACHMHNKRQSDAALIITLSHARSLHTCSPQAKSSTAAIHDELSERHDKCM
jgi:hypothetical protein